MSWERHPGVKSGDQLSLGERSADHMRNGMGSWPFVFGFLSAMVLWAFTNTVILGHSAFDPYPYILLNLFLSMLAGLQGAILLIAAKRADAIAAQQAIHHLQVSESTKALLEQNTELTKQVHDLTELVAKLSNEIRDHIIAS